MQELLEDELPNNTQDADTPFQETSPPDGACGDMVLCERFDVTALFSEHAGTGVDATQDLSLIHI